MHCSCHIKMTVKSCYYSCTILPDVLFCWNQTGFRGGNVGTRVFTGLALQVVTLDLHVALRFGLLCFRFSSFTFCLAFPLHFSSLFCDFLCAFSSATVTFPFFIKLAFAGSLLACILTTLSLSLEALDAASFCWINSFFLQVPFNFYFFLSLFIRSSDSLLIRANSGVAVATVDFPRFLPVDFSDLGSAYKWLK